MKRTVIVYGVAIAIAALALQWLDYQYTVKVFSTEAYVVVIAGAFTVLGLWVGSRSLTLEVPPNRSRRTSKRSQP